MNPTDQYQPLYGVNAGKKNRKFRDDRMSNCHVAAIGAACLFSIVALGLGIAAIEHSNGGGGGHHDDDDGGSWTTVFLEPTAAAIDINVADFSVNDTCAGITCETLPNSTCTDGGFVLSLASWQLNVIDSTATYTYQLCDPPLGVCINTTTGLPYLKNGQPKTCKDHGQCTGNPLPASGLECNRTCVVDEFHALSHMDVAIPIGVSQCLLPGVQAIVGCSTGTPTLGDASCSDGPDATVVKCDSPTLGTDQCMTMTVSLAGEAGQLGLGKTYVVDKASDVCVATCIAGPSCDRCDGETQPDEDRCLTRTIGFWGTHPWITNDFATADSPVTVCGKDVSCNGADTSKSAPSCEYNHCDNIMEALGSIPGEAAKADRQYVAMLRQLTAAKLNVKATAASFDAEQYTLCASWTASSAAGSLAGQGIADIIAYCEANACSAASAAADVAACIAALDEFNNTPDALGDNGPTPGPFDRPGIDDSDAVSGADSSSFTAAQRSGLIIGRKLGSKDCR